VVFVAGNAGSGKTTLLDEFAACMQAHSNLIAAAEYATLIQGLAILTFPF
jgi:ABC-type lipoprotein export system ATPase subunit